MINDMQSVAAGPRDGISRHLDRAAALGPAHLTHGLSTVRMILAATEAKTRGEEGVLVERLECMAQSSLWSPGPAARQGLPSLADLPGLYALEK